MDLKKYLEAGKIGKEAREYGKELIKEGASYYDVANKVEKYILDAGAKPAFPVNLSPNNIAAHYSPIKGDGMYFRRGDLIKLDLGAHIDGYISDTAVTVEVGTRNWEELIEASSEALKSAIKILRPGIEIREIGAAIEEEITIRGFRPIYNLTGHGLARYDLHHEISIPNYDDGTRTVLRPGMAFAIEPFATTGRGKVRNGKGGNIYILTEYRHLDGFFSEIFEKYRTLPFAARWCEHHEDYLERLKEGTKKGVVHHFAILQERKKAMVAQTEHTFVMTDEGAIVTTQ
ncbi:MAG: type II methionyl aminopeptidase [Euryarchaeota archaeon]|nr:type II methionyl aminopeptidase [Euryarchaeota archaeon]